MIGMLKRAEDGEDIALLVGRALGLLAQLIDVADHRVPVVAGKLDGGYDGIGAIERADGDRDRHVAPLVGERRSTLIAEAALHAHRRPEQRRVTAGPFDRRLEGDERRGEVAERLLAHAAIADRGVANGPRNAVSHGAALAAASEDIG